MISEHGAGGGQDHNWQQIGTTGRGEDAGGDDGAFARQHDGEHVEGSQGEDRGVQPR